MRLWESKKESRVEKAGKRTVYYVQSTMTCFLGNDSRRVVRQ